MNNEEVFTVTKPQIIEIFKMWDGDYLTNPGNYAPLSESNPEAQAQEFLRIRDIILKK